MTTNQTLPVPSNKQLREKIEGLIEKHTVALTKTHPENVPEGLVSFDTRVVNTYELENDLLQLFIEQSNRQIMKLSELSRAQGLLQGMLDGVEQMGLNINEDGLKSVLGEVIGILEGFTHQQEVDEKENNG